MFRTAECRSKPGSLLICRTSPWPSVHTAQRFPLLLHSHSHNLVCMLVPPHRRYLTLDMDLHDPENGMQPSPTVFVGLADTSHRAPARVAQTPVSRRGARQPHACCAKYPANNTRTCQKATRHTRHVSTEAVSPTNRLDPHLRIPHSNRAVHVNTPYRTEYCTQID